MSHDTASQTLPVISLDLGDRRIELARREGDAIVHEQLAAAPDVVRERFASEPRSRVVIEAGSQSHWVTWMLEDLGHEVLVADPRRLKMVSGSSRKSDRRDAEWLLLLGEVRLEILSPIDLRSRESQADLVHLRVRSLLTEMRTKAVQAVRGHAKLFGCPLPRCSVESLPKHARAHLADDVRRGCEPLLLQIETLTHAIRESEARLERIAEKRASDVQPLRQVAQIGTVTALTYVLTLQDAKRFPKGRAAGPACGLVPRRDASGSRDPELRITKRGDVELRRLLVLAAQRILRQAEPDSDLKRFGMTLAARGGKNAKKRAVVAVARKLSVLLMALWKSGEVYEPLRTARRTPIEPACAA